MPRIEAMVYDEGLGEAKVTELMVNMVNTEQLPFGKKIGIHSEVWDGPVADAKTSPYYQHFPEFIIKQDYNPRFMKSSRIKVLSLELVDIEAPPVTAPPAPEPVEIADVETPSGS